MPTYRFQWYYQSGVGTWTQHTEVDFSEEQAAHINADSPGVLVLVGGEERALTSAPNRQMVSASANRAVEPDDEPEVSGQVAEVSEVSAPRRAVADLGLSAAVTKALAEYFESAEEVAAATDDDLLSLDGITPARLAKIRGAL